VINFRQGIENVNKIAMSLTGSEDSKLTILKKEGINNRLQSGHSEKLNFMVNSMNII